MEPTICYSCFQPVAPGVKFCPNCGRSTAQDWEKHPHALPYGTVLGGRYITGRVLGQGGFGITYIAQDHKDGRLVAVKEFFPDTMASRGEGNSIVPYTGQRGEDFVYGRTMFLEEARTLATLRDVPGVVQVFSYFEEFGTAYFAMEYVDHVNFQNYIEQQGGRISVEDAQRILIPVMDTMAAVHAKGIIHRDIKPDNIYINSQGQVKILDFGSARYSMGEKSRSLDVILTHGFAPREQYSRHGRQGAYTDVYALAATFYYAITGRKPPDSIDRIDEDALALPSSLGAQISPAVEDVLMHALAVEPQDRFPTMTAFKEALLHPESFHPAAAGPAGGAPGPSGVGNGYGQTTMPGAAGNPSFVNPDYVPRQPTVGGRSASSQPGPSGNYNPAPGPSGNYNPPPGPSGNYNPAPGPSGNYNPAPGPSGNYNPAPGPSGNYNPAPGPSGSYNPVPPAQPPQPQKKNKWVLPVGIGAAAVAAAVAVILLLPKKPPAAPSIDKEVPQPSAAPMATLAPPGESAVPVSSGGTVEVLDPGGKPSLSSKPGLGSVAGYYLLTQVSGNGMTFDATSEAAKEMGLYGAYIQVNDEKSASFHAEGAEQELTLDNGKVELDGVVCDYTLENGVFTLIADLTGQDVGLITMTFTRQGDAPPDATPAPSASAAPAETAQSGKCGENVSWSFDGETLTVTGTGKMDDYTNTTQIPWYDYNADIDFVVVGEGITRIGEGNFYHCEMVDVELPDTLQTIGANAFLECPWLFDVTVPAGVQGIGTDAFAYCERLEWARINSAAANLYATCFDGCAAMTDVYFAGDAGSIAADAFQGCTATVHIPNRQSWNAWIGKDLGGKLTWSREDQGVIDAARLYADKYSVAIPANWQGILMADVRGSDMLFYHRDSAEYGAGGFLFSLSLFQNYNDYAAYPSYNVLGNLTDGSTYYTVVELLPSDVQFPAAYQEDYMFLFNNLWYITQYLGGENGYTFVPNT